MKTKYAEQYGTACVQIEKGDIAEDVIEQADIEGAFFEEGPGEFAYVVEFPGRFPELYTDEALVRSLEQLK